MRLRLAWLVGIVLIHSCVRIVFPELHQAILDLLSLTGSNPCQIRQWFVGFRVVRELAHSVDDKTAFEVEAALIDPYPGLTNAVTGSGSNEYSAMHAQEIVNKYQAEPADFKHRAIIINVNRSATESSLYEATRYAWKISHKKASRGEIVCAVRFGIIVAVFVADKWLPATTEHFPGREPVADRYGFIGAEASDTIRRMYIGKRLPDEFRKQGAANPIKYTYQ